jgi:hypothetical protein
LCFIESSNQKLVSALKTKIVAKHFPDKWKWISGPILLTCLVVLILATLAVKNFLQVNAKVS